MRASVFRQSIRSAVSTGTGYDGVVRISTGTHYASGVLLYDGRAVLTAAHLFASGHDSVAVRFDTVSGTETRDVRHVEVHPAYDALNGNGDLALVWLASPAPVTAVRHALYREADEIGQVFTFAGYGASGYLTQDCTRATIALG